MSKTLEKYKRLKFLDQKTDDALSDLITYFKELEHKDGRLDKLEIADLLKFFEATCAEISALYHGSP